MNYFPKKRLINRLKRDFLQTQRLFFLPQLRQTEFLCFLVECFRTGILIQSFFVSISKWLLYVAIMMIFLRYLTNHYSCEYQNTLLSFKTILVAK